MIVNSILSNALMDCGVAQIHTNDAAQGPDPKPARKHA
jgi:hypothetical protein